jgi:pimeloyl-ACP methyl ester carboxylesterase
VEPEPEHIRPPRVLVIPGLDGSSLLVQTAAARLFAGMRPLIVDHHLDPMDGGLDGLADRAMALLDADSDPHAQTFVCGESFGGIVALTLARRYPTRFQGVILLSTFACYPAGISRWGRAGLWLWDRLGDSITARILSSWHPLSLPGSLGVRPPSDIARAYLRQPRPHVRGYRAKCELALTFDARPWLREVTCPALIVTGTLDPVVPTSAGRELARLLPRARLHRLPGRHLVYFVRAEETGALIRQWVDDVGAAPPLDLLERSVEESHRAVAHPAPKRKSTSADLPR